MAARVKLPGSWPARLQSWVGGAWRPSTSASVQTLPVHCSALNKTLCEYEVAGTEDVEEAVRVATAAQREWARWAPAERGRVLRRAADILTERNDELSALEAFDTSRPLQETLYVDIVSARDALEYYGGLAATIGGEMIQQPNQSWAYTIREPLGVTCGIGAWNYPMQSAGWKAAPALACGNAILFKPAEDTPLTALALGEVLREAGLPDGLYNVMLGAGETGQLLTRHPGISKVSFTGSVPTGKAICRDAADSLKKVQMELGGKSPLIIFEDTDLDEAVSATMLANWYSNGEVCSNGTRVFVQASIKDRFLDELVRRTGKIKLGDPLDMETQMSALINEKHFAKVMSYIEKGQAEGARLVMGGERVSVEGDCAASACFMTPAIFDNCTDDMSIVREEIFGPVASILTFETEEEVVRRANDTDFGLSAGVFTNDIRRAHRVIREVKAGTTWINNYNLAPAEIPWIGHKSSGIGGSNGTLGIEDWTQIKSVYVEMDKVDCPYE
ncbi:Aldehyde dehydrogenase [Hondaea fermentalgiana]|uniref:Aldehyde dehydrogenase n=1 Tax=Hondaea fermentalgiana TaxID=2315210 RepID=A0A2R5GLK5_9STRA|nr:Aldehyde dehydrogenase [Hondaea fermentalgiana]|eukprot:GBG31515.1 Aldehyde dehydrogenase [Hondaea fermentalgiana]